MISKNSTVSLPAVFSSASRASSVDLGPHAGAGHGVGLLLAGGSGVHSDRFTGADQILTGLVLSQAELQVVLVLVLHAAIDEEANQGRAILIHGTDDVEAGEGVQGIHQVVAGQAVSAVEIGHRGRGNGVGGLSHGGDHGQHHDGGQQQGKELAHGVYLLYLADHSAFSKNIPRIYRISTHYFRKTADNTNRR